MSMRRLPFLPWLLGACLLLAQAGMLWHDVDHARERLVEATGPAAAQHGMIGLGAGLLHVAVDADAEVDTDADTDAGTACAVCLAHAALQTGLAGTPAVWLPPAPAAGFTAREGSAVALASRWARHGRDPPRVGPILRA